MDNFTRSIAIIGLCAGLGGLLVGFRGSNASGYFWGGLFLTVLCSCILFAGKEEKDDETENNILSERNNDFINGNTGSDGTKNKTAEAGNKKAADTFQTKYKDGILFEDMRHIFFERHSDDPRDSARKFKEYRYVFITAGKIHLDGEEGYPFRGMVIADDGMRISYEDHPHGYDDLTGYETADHIRFEYHIQESQHDGGGYTNSKTELKYRPDIPVSQDRCHDTVYNQYDMPESNGFWLDGNRIFIYEPFGLNGIYEFIIDYIEEYP